MKIEISNQVKIDLSELVFRRGGAHGTELLEDDDSLKAAQFYNMMSLYLEKGIPSQVGQKRVNFFLAKPSQTFFQEANPENGIAVVPDNNFFSFEELMEIPVKIAVKTCIVKQRVIEAIGAKFPEIGITKVDPSRIRLREKTGEDKLTQVYHE